MHLAISTLCCPAWSLPRIAMFAREHGIGGIELRGLGEEIDVTKLPAFSEDLPATLKLLQHGELEIPCLSTSVTLVTPAPERWQQMLDECQRTARLAERTHTRFIRVFGGAVPKGITSDEALVLARRHLRQLVKVAGAFGARVLVETHDDWSTSGDLLELTREFDPQHEVGVIWDIEHTFRHGEAPADTFASLRRLIAHVHLKDSVRASERSVPKLLGEGELPVRECLRVLREDGYDAWLSLETEKRWHADAPEPEQSIPHFARFMRERASGT
jgi:sugar phosphate isomerase/epimerase